MATIPEEEEIMSCRWCNEECDGAICETCRAIVAEVVAEVVRSSFDMDKLRQFFKNMDNNAG